MPKLVSIKRNVTLWDRGVIETDPVAGNPQTRLFFNNPLQNSRARTPGQTNMNEPGKIPAQSMIRIYALCVTIEGFQASGLEDPANTAAFRDLIRILRGGTFELFIGSSNDARLALPLSEVLKTLEWAEADIPTQGPGPVETGQIRIGRTDPRLGIWYPLRGDVVEVAAQQTFSMLIQHDSQADLDGLTLVDPIVTGILQADVIGSLAETYGRLAG